MEQKELWGMRMEGEEMFVRNLEDKGLFFFKILTLDGCIFKYKFIFKEKNLSKRSVRNSAEISSNHSHEMIQ